MNDFQIVPVESRSAIREFIGLSAKLHRNHANWVPPIYSEERNYFNRSKNHAFNYCSTAMAMAKLNGETVGRILAIINHRYNSAKQEKTARFSQFECINDPGISAALLGFAENWAMLQGMNCILGPLGMHYFDPMGFLVEGFDEKPSFAANYNFDYMDSLLERSGYSSATDLVVYNIKVPEVFPDFYLRIQQRSMQNGKLKIQPIKSKKDIQNFIFPVLGMMNETYENILGYSQLEKDEMQKIAHQFIPLLDPRFLVVATYDNEVAGFIVAVPSLNEGIIAAGGRLFPLGFLKIMRAALKATQLDLLIGAVKNKYQGLGIDVMMGIHTIETAKKYGFTTIDSHLELVSNTKVRAEMEKMGGRITKKYRIYQKNL